MPPAIIGGAVAAAGTIGGALLSSHAQKKASSQANEAQQAATDAQLQLGRESLGLNQDIYNSNFNLLSPYVSRGNVAGDTINALLGLPSPPAAQSPLGSTAMASGTVPAPGGIPAASGGPSGIQYAPVVSQTPLSALSPASASQQPVSVAGINDPRMAAKIANGFMPAEDLAIAHEAYDGITRPGSDFSSVTAATQPPAGAIGHVENPRDHPARDAINANRAQRGLPPLGGTQAPPVAGAPGGGAAQPNALSPQMQAFENFANSAGMQFQQQQAADAINNLYAAHGALQSGAAEKAISDRAEDIALNNFFMPYLGLLGNQQAVGAGAGAAVAGVGTSFGNTAANINAGMGSSIGAGANAAAQNAYNHGAANAGMYGTIGSALGGLASSFFPGGGSGFGSSPIMVTGGAPSPGFSYI